MEHSLCLPDKFVIKGFCWMRPIIFIAVFLLCLVREAGAQTPFICRDVIASAGGQGASAGKQFEFTLGEPAIQSLAAVNVFLSQGFAQPELCPLVLSDTETPVTTGDFRLYPNPVFDRLNLQFGDASFQDARVLVYSATGQCIRQATFTNPGLSLDCSFLPSGPYFLILRSINGQNLIAVPFLKQGF